MLDARASQWAMMEDTAGDEDAPVSEVEMAAAVKLIRARLVRYGLGDADRIRRHLRRCDDAKGYLSRLTSVEDTYAVFNTLALRRIRRKVWLELFNRFHRGPDEPGDNVSVIKYNELCDFLMEGYQVPEGL